MNNEHIEVKIPKEIMTENAFIGPFSIRQSFALLMMAIVAIPIYNLCKNYLGMDLSLAVCMIAALPFGCFGWIKIHGQPFEKFFKFLFISLVLTPSRRKYKTENFYTDIIKEAEKEEYNALSKKQKKTLEKQKKQKKSKKALK